MAVIGDVGGALRIQTGAVDRLSDVDRKVRIVNGHALMAKVTGTGCLSGGIIAAFMAVEPDAMLAAASALTVTGVSAEIAAQTCQRARIVRSRLSGRPLHLKSEDILSHARIEHDED